MGTVDEIPAKFELCADAHSLLGSGGLIKRPYIAGKLAIRSGGIRRTNEIIFF